MNRVLVVYDSKYGNTRLVAEKIAEGLDEGDNAEVVVSNVRKIDVTAVTDFDAVLIGTPTHFGAPTRAVNKLIDKLGNLRIRIKFISVFATYFKGDVGKAVSQMEDRIRVAMPDLKIISPGLSIDVKEIKGPVPEEEIPKCIEFGKMISMQL